MEPSVTLFSAAYNPKEWKESKDVSCPAVAAYDFTAASEKELSFNAGQTMTLAPIELQPHGARGWLLATVDGNRVGYIPYNYIRVLSATKGAAAHNVQGVTVPVQSARVDTNQGKVEPLFYNFFS
jgi:peroxin-13